MIEVPVKAVWDLHLHVCVWVWDDTQMCVCQEYDVRYLYLPYFVYWLPQNIVYKQFWGCLKIFFVSIIGDFMYFLVGTSFNNVVVIKNWRNPWYGGWSIEDNNLILIVGMPDVQNFLHEALAVIISKLQHLYTRRKLSVSCIERYHFPVACSMCV